MEINKVYQAPEQIAVSAQSDHAQQVSEKTQAAGSNVTVQKDFQVNLQDGLKIKLAEFANILQNREQLIQSLPEDIRKAVAELLGRMAADTELPQGLENFLKGQKSTVEQLKDMSTILDFSAALQKDEHKEVKVFLQKTFENFTKQAGMTPEQSAKELMQLAKQLPVSLVMAQGNVSQGEQLLEQTVPQNMQQLSPDEQKIIAKLTKVLGQDMPAQVQQLSQQKKIPELAGAWATLKAVDAWQFKDIQPKTLQAAADLLRQLAQEMEPDTGIMTGKLEQFIKGLPAEVDGKGTATLQLEQFVKTLPHEIGNKGTVVAQLEQFIRTLPAEIGKALQKALQQGNITENLRSLADTFNNAEVLNENMTSDMKSLLLKMDESFVAKSPSIPADNNHVLTQLAKQFMDTGKTIEQLKAFINQLKTQLLTADPAFLEQEHVLDQIMELFEPNIPQVLQEGGARHKLPELPKLWVLLKALGAEQWQEIESQSLQKSAGVVKELAQSIYKSTALTGEKQAEHSTLSFSIPLHVAEGVCYPAHIHIYHEEKNNSSQLKKREFETWLRICVDTENIGVVDSVFRLYGDNKLDVRVNFPVMSAAGQFAQDLPDIRKSLENSKFTLTDVTVSGS